MDTLTLVTMKRILQITDNLGLIENFEEMRWLGRTAIEGLIRLEEAQQQLAAYKADLEYVLVDNAELRQKLEASK